MSTNITRVTGLCPPRHYQSHWPMSSQQCRSIWARPDNRSFTWTCNWRITLLTVNCCYKHPRLEVDPPLAQFSHTVLAAAAPAPLLCHDLCSRCDDGVFVVWGLWGNCPSLNTLVCGGQVSDLPTYNPGSFLETCSLLVLGKLHQKYKHSDSLEPDEWILLCSCSPRGTCFLILSRGNLLINRNSPALECVKFECWCQHFHIFLLVARFLWWSRTIHLEEKKANWNACQTTKEWCVFVTCGCT